LLRALMIGEEKVILGGNNSLALGNTPVPTLSSANTGGALLGNTAYGVGVVALTLEGYFLATVAGGIVQSTTRTNADGSNDTVNGGAARPSTAANVTTANTGANTHCVNASVAVVVGAVAYAWYLGLAAGNLVLHSITTINSANLTANGAGTQVFSTLTASDLSRNSLIFDGLMTFHCQTALGATVVTQATGTPGVGTVLTSDNAGGIVEIDAALKAFWDNYRLSPDTLWVSSQQMQDIGKKILQGNSTAAQRFVFNAEQGMIGGGIMVRTYLNKFGMNGATELKIRLHPNMPSGTMMFTTNKLPYPLSNVTNVTQIRARREYYQIEWPLRTRKYEYGVYCDEVLQHFFPPSGGVINNIAAG